MNLCDQNSGYLKQLILTNAVTLSKKDILGILKNLQAAHGDSTASPLPPLRRQHVKLRDEKP